MPERETVMIVDGTGRAHALSKRYELSPDVGKIVVAPGNGLIAYRREKEVVIEPCDLDDAESILEVAKRHRPTLVDVAQDNALAAGTVDLLEAHGFTAVGPTKEAAEIESSKAWSRQFQSRHELPVPHYEAFSAAEAGRAKKYLASRYAEHPRTLLFIKADGLHAGKGALPANNLEEALEAVDTVVNELGDSWFLIEDGFKGEEFSWTGLTDGATVHSLRSSQDNKRLLDGDKGPMTGGMGVITPALVTEGLEGRIEQEIMRRTIDGLREEGRRFQGFLYLGGMVLDRGGIGIIEFNARIGAPEAEVLLDGLSDDVDYLDLMKRVHDGELRGAELRQDGLCRAYVVCAAPGYPGSYEQGMRITGLDAVMDMPDADVLGYAVDINDDGTHRASGGRLFGVLGRGPDTVSALQRAYDAIKHIDIEGGFHYRTDIGWRDVRRLQATSA
jgi:phosphoribosylamine---glycine ligase